MAVPFHAPARRRGRTMGPTGPEPRSGGREEAMRGNAPGMGDFNGMGLTALRRDTFERSTRDAR